MASSFFYRLIRRLRTSSVHIAAFILFSGLLTFIFVLYQPTNGPGDTSQRIGWQSWEVVSEISETNRPAHEPIQNPIDAPALNSTDWWDAETAKDPIVNTTSLPLDYWAPLLPHDTGLTEIAVVRCLVPPWLFPGMCEPGTTQVEAAAKGKWVRVERNIDKAAVSWYLHIYYRRTRKLDVPLVTELRLLPKNGEIDLSDRHAWYSAGTSIRDGIPGTPPLYLWFKLGPSMQQLNKTQARDIITELDVIYGAGPPMYGFENLDPPVSPDKKGQTEVRISYRKGPPSVPPVPPLHFNHDGTYKILQVADLHFSVSHGKCRDTEVPCDEADDLTSDLLASALDAEKPDFVVFTGDQLNGQGTSWDSRSVLAKFAIPVISRKIPWTAVFGNHDSETDMDREIEMKHLCQLPYFVGSAGPTDVHGVGNYVLKVRSADPSKVHLLTMYFLDSGDYDTGTYDLFGFFRPTTYDYLRENQIDWFLSESAKISPIQRPHTPDGAKDLGDLWERQATSPSNIRLAKPNALMFFHIPLQETYNDPDKDPISGKSLDVGQQLDGPGTAVKNAGFFRSALLNATEGENNSFPEVKVVGNGHCHVSENCRRIRGIWFCFGGGGSYAGYGKVGFDRRFRIYSILDNGETIRTYKRTEHGDILDEMILAGEGAAPI